MKLSYVVNIPDKRVAGQKGWQAEMSTLHSLGYQGVELAVANPEYVDTCAIMKIIERCKLEAPAIGTGGAFVQEGLSLSSLDKGIRHKAINRIGKHVDLANSLNSKVIIGLVRGRIDGILKDRSLWDKGYKNLMASMKEICEYASKKDVEVLLEPINHYETTFLNNVDEAVGFIKKIHSPNLGLLLDTFHINIEEKDFNAPIRKASGYLSHFHFADNNRRCPGDGHIDFAAVIKTLKRAGYAGYVSAEVSPLPDFRTCARNYSERIGRNI